MTNRYSVRQKWFTGKIVAVTRCWLDFETTVGSRLTFLFKKNLEVGGKFWNLLEEWRKAGVTRVVLGTDTPDIGIYVFIKMSHGRGKNNAMRRTERRIAQEHDYQKMLEGKNPVL